jgi:phosphoribosylformimino-5-aminoimidazole carboxamide ribonucleotide (ProFAR) isomerase
MTNRKNSEFLAETIEKFRERISIGLDRFKIKRDYVEKFSETNSAEISDMLKKTLNLLALQLKEFKIKNQLNQIILK